MPAEPARGPAPDHHTRGLPVARHRTRNEHRVDQLRSRPATLPARGRLMSRGGRGAEAPGQRGVRHQQGQHARHYGRRHCAGESGVRGSAHGSWSGGLDAARSPLSLPRSQGSEKGSAGGRSERKVAGIPGHSLARPVPLEIASRRLMQCQRRRRTSVALGGAPLGLKRCRLKRAAHQPEQLGALVA